MVKLMKCKTYETKITNSWPLRGGREGQPLRSAWPLHIRFFFTPSQYSTGQYTIITSVGHPWPWSVQMNIWCCNFEKFVPDFFLGLPPKALPGSTGGGGGGWGGGGWGGEEGLGEEGGGGGGWRQQRLHPSPRPPSPWRGESHARAQILKNPRNPQKIPAHLLLLTSLTSLLLNIHSICFPIRTITSNHIKP